MNRVENYHVAEFKSHEACSAFREALILFIKEPGGSRFLKNEPRCVVWVPASSVTTVYLSPGAVQAVKHAGLLVSITAEIEVSELPRDKSLILGDTFDLKNTESEA